VNIANALQLESSDVAPVFQGCFGHTCTAHAHKLPVLNQNSDIAIRFKDSDFLESNNFAIRRRFYAVTLTSTTWPWTFIVRDVSLDQTMYQIWVKSNKSRLSYWQFGKFFRQFFNSELFCRHDISELGSDLHQIQKEDGPIICASNAVFRFNIRCRCFVSKLHRLKGQVSKYLTPAKMRRGWAKCLELERRSNIVAQGRSVRFPLCCFEPRARQRRLEAKIEARFRTFWPHPCKTVKGVGEICDGFLRVQSRIKPLIYFWLSVSGPSGRLECGCREQEKRQRQNRSLPDYRQAA